MKPKPIYFAKVELTLFLNFSVQWLSTSNMNEPRVSHTASTPQMEEYYSRHRCSNGHALNSTELYDALT